MVLKPAVVIICVYSYHSKIPILFKAWIVFMLIAGKKNMKHMRCFKHCCTSDCLYYKVLSIVNDKGKHTSAVFHNVKDRSDMAGSKDFTF